MNTFQVNLFVAFFGLLQLSTSITVSEPKMTWADVFKDRLEVKDMKRQQRSHYSTKKAYVLSNGFESDAGQGQYSLQYLDGHYYNQDSNKESLLSGAHELKYLTVKDTSSIFDKDKIKSNLLKAPLSFIYTEAAQPAEHQHVTEGYKFVTVPHKYDATSLQSTEGSHYYKLKDYDHEDNYESKYKFGYRVSDPHTGAEFGHSEVSEGHVKKGQYHVLLPDGRLQNVKYWADPSGYHATVTYEGHGYHYPSYH